MDKYSDIELLRSEFGNNKEIPAKYEDEILIALAHYPELKQDKIRFELALGASVPYSTKPTFKSCFLPKHQRVYTITILEAADKPEEEALLKNLDRKMRLGVLGHELGHVLQYRDCSAGNLIRTLSLYPFGAYRRKLERSADKAAIEHGLGEELLRHAEFIRLIPDYLKKRPELDRDYLKPEEIARYMSHLESVKAA